jgi:hypothetical protein
MWLLRVVPPADKAFFGLLTKRASTSAPKARSVKAFLDLMITNQLIAS